jgi:hypothetical protein
MSDSDTEVEDLTPAQKETSSRHKKQMIKQRRCTNLINTRNEFGGIATIRKPGMAFKKKNKPGTGGRKNIKSQTSSPSRGTMVEKALVNLCGLFLPAIISKNGWPSRTNCSKAKRSRDCGRLPGSQETAQTAQMDTWTFTQGDNAPFSWSENCTKY